MKRGGLFLSNRVWAEVEVELRGATPKIDKTKVDAARLQRCADHRCNHHHAFNVFVDSVGHCSLPNRNSIVVVHCLRLCFEEEISTLQEKIHVYLHRRRLRTLYCLISFSIYDLNLVLN